MPTIADFVVVPETDGAFTLPAPNGGSNDFHSRPFDAPAVSVGSPSVLTFRVNPTGTVKLQVNINDQLVVLQTFNTDPQRSWHEVVGGNVLRASGNTLDVAVLSNGGGSVQLSDFVIFFQASI